VQRLLVAEERARVRARAAVLTDDGVAAARQARAAAELVARGFEAAGEYAAATGDDADTVVDMFTKMIVGAVASLAGRS